MVRRNITGAGYGFNSWIGQRITAVIMLVVIVVFLLFVAYLATNVNSSIASWQAVFKCSFVKIFVQLFFVALFYHAWVGMRDLWMDYITCNSLKLTMHIITILWLLANLIYSIKIIWA